MTWRHGRGAGERTNASTTWMRDGGEEGGGWGAVAVRADGSTGKGGGVVEEIEVVWDRQARTMTIIERAVTKKGSNCIIQQDYLVSYGHICKRTIRGAV